MSISAGSARTAGCARAPGEPLGFQHDGRHGGHQQEECKAIIASNTKPIFGSLLAGLIQKGPFLCLTEPVDDNTLS